MKLTRDDARRQAARLQSSPMLAPQSDEGRTEVVDCLMRHCVDKKHAEAVVTELLDNVLRPKNITAEIAAIANRTQREDQAPPGCNRCSLGEDVSTRVMRWAPFVPVEIDNYSAAERCSCARGQWLAARAKTKEGDS